MYILQKEILTEGSVCKFQKVSLYLKELRYKTSSDEIERFYF